MMLFFIVNGSIRITSIGKYLEIYLDGWKYVCGINFYHEDAIVACRQQGFSNVRNRNHVYSNDDTYWRRTIDCIGNETNLLDCPYTTTYSNCNYKVKLYCETGKLFYINILLIEYSFYFLIFRKL